MVLDPASHPRSRDGYPSDAADDPAEDDARGRHATGRGDGFGRLAGLTVLGAVVPGLGLVLAGRRRTGWAVLAPVLLVVGALAAVVASGRAVSLARRYAFQPQLLLGVAVGAVVVGLLWCLVIIASHRALRRARLTGGQRVLSVLLVGVLVALVAVPTATAVKYATSARSVLLTSFGGQRGTDDGLSNPDVAARDPWAGTPRVNVLLLGADTGADRTGTRPDTIIVASIDTTSGDTVLFSLPRQLSDVPFPAGSPAAAAWPKACAANGQGGCELNAVYLFGTQHPELFPGAADPGVAATRAAASAALGLRIDYEATIDLQGFQDLVDTMGGLTLNVPRDIPIGGGDILGRGGRVVGHYPVTGVIPKGQGERLNGYQALWFARSRWLSTNDDRMARQQCVINAAVDQYDVFALARAFPALAASATRNLSTDIPASQINAFIDLGQRVKGGSLRALSFTSANISTGHPDYAQLQGLVRDALVPPAPSTPATPAAGAAPAPAPAPAGPDQPVDTSAVC